MLVSCVFSRRFRRKSRLFQWLVFFVSSTRSVHFFVHLFNIINLNYGRPKHNRNARNSSQTKKSTSRTSKTQVPLDVFHSNFFRHSATFLEDFGFPQRVSPSFVSIFSNTMDVKKIQRIPFYVFRHCDTVQKISFIFFRNFFKICQGSPLIFFQILQPNGVSQSPFYNFEP